LKAATRLDLSDGGGWQSKNYLGLWV